jgi:hypothetical protein
MTILPVADSGTAPIFFVGVPTKTLASVRWIKWSIAKVNRSRFYSAKSSKVPFRKSLINGAM